MPSRRQLLVLAALPVSGQRAFAQEIDSISGPVCASASAVSFHLEQATPIPGGFERIDIGFAVASDPRTSLRDVLARPTLSSELGSRTTHVPSSHPRVFAFGPEIASEDSVDRPAVECRRRGIAAACSIRASAPRHTPSFRRIVVRPVLVIDLALHVKVTTVTVHWQLTYPDAESPSRFVRSMTLRCERPEAA